MREGTGRSLLYIDSSYTLEQIRDRRLDQVLSVRSLDGYFHTVWSAHPLDTHPVTSPSAAPIGKPLLETVGENHVFIRGRSGRYGALQRLTTINSALALASFIRCLAGLARRERIDIVRAGDPILSGLIGLFVARVSGAAFAVRVNANNDMIRASTRRPVLRRFTRTRWLEEKIEQAVLSRADVVLVPSQNYLAFALTKGASRERVVIARYGSLVDPAHLLPVEARPELNDATITAELSSRPYLGHVGRLIDLKHVEDCLEVLRLTHAAGLDVGLCFVGDGPLRSTLEQRSKALRLDHRVLFLGNVDQPLLASLLPYFAVVLSPLTGRALVEAAFAGRPIIAYDLDWQGELIESESTGLLVPARDVESMAIATMRLLADPNLAQRLGIAVRKRALSLLDPTTSKAAETLAYDRVASRQPPLNLCRTRRR